MKKLLLGVVLLLIGSNATAEWRYSEFTDEMRQEKSYIGTLTSEDNLGLRMEFNALSFDNKLAKKVSLSIDGDSFDCQSDDCSVLIRYGDGPIKKALIFARGAGGALFDEQGSFIETAKLVDLIFIEVPLTNRGTTQFKFKNKGLKWRGVEEKKDFVNKFFNIDFTLPKNINNLESYEEKTKNNCIKNKELLRDSTFGVKPLEASYCLNDKGFISSMHLSYPADKKVAEKIKKLLIESRGEGIDLDNGSYMTIGDEYSSISVITIMSNPNKYSVDVYYNPNNT